MQSLFIVTKMTIIGLILYLQFLRKNLVLVTTQKFFWATQFDEASFFLKKNERLKIEISLR